MRQELIEHCRKFMPVEQEYKPHDRKFNTLYVSREFPEIKNGKNTVFAYIDIAPGFNIEWFSQIQSSTDFLPGYRIKVQSVPDYQNSTTKPWAFYAEPL